MPTLHLTGWNGGFSWRVTDLGSTFSAANYVEIGITYRQFTEGGVTSISGIVSTVYPTTDSANNHYTFTVDVTYEPGTYTFYAYAKVPGNGTYWPAGSATVTVPNPSGTRPISWAWQSSIVSGGVIGLTAAEWTMFCARINAFRSYVGLTQYNFTAVSSGATISADICNQAWYAINEIPGHGSMPSMAVSGGALYASFFTGLRDALNAVT